MRMICAVDQNWGIGRNGGLLFHIPRDMQFFRTMTIGKVVVMGRCTLASFPGGKPLAGRLNVVLSHASPADEDVIHCFSPAQLMSEVRKHDPDDVFVIGGASVYGMLMDCCTDAFVTHVERSEEADRFISPLAGRGGWELAEMSDTQTDAGVSFRFARYVNRRVRSVPAAEYSAG